MNNLLQPTTIALVILSLLTTYLLLKYIQLISLTATSNPKKITTESIFLYKRQNTPKIIWSYWHQDNPPDFVICCAKNWKSMAPDFQVHLLNRASISEWIDVSQLPINYDQLPAYRQADWLRLELLRTHGGTWIDASIILTQSLNWLQQLEHEASAEYVGFYIEKFTHREAEPIIENWFMSAQLNSQFISDLANEFNYAIKIGENLYLEELKDKGLFEQVIQNISPPKLHSYLIMHVAASVIQHRNPNKYRLSLLKAEDSAFTYHQLVRWSKKTLHAKLALTPCPKLLPVLIKLRGGERNTCNDLLKKGLYIRGSLFYKFLNLQKEKILN